VQSSPCFAPIFIPGAYVLAWSLSYCASLQGKSSLPFPSIGYWASSRIVDSRQSLFVNDPEGADAIPAFPPFFFQCDGQCKGGPNFECVDGYTGTQCSECQPGQFYWNSKCDTKCSDIEPQAAVSIFGMIAVIFVWIIINNSAGGVCVFPCVCCVHVCYLMRFLTVF
jgi:hypothetical protein